jgi:hypothetical protein
MGSTAGEYPLNPENFQHRDSLVTFGNYRCVEEEI